MGPLFQGWKAEKPAPQTFRPKARPSITLVLSVSLLVFSAFNYGFDDQAFATVQAMDPFIKEFGHRNLKTNIYVIPTIFSSLYNSLKAGGQIVG
jgi:SP family sugar:H+ symporter-like MFS transporter